MIADPHQIQRLRFTPGQDLLARDFRDGETFEARLRHWHNRALHRIYGVVSGLEATEIYLAGAVDVKPGLAYDATGRELALTTQRIVAYPVDAAPGAWLLVIRRSAGLAWVPLAALQTCDSVPLARIDVDSLRRIFFDFSFLPPVARPLARPRIGYGSTAPGGTAWQAELLTEPVGNPPATLLALRVEVNIQAAGFMRLPCCFAWLEGRLLYPFPPDTLHAKPKLDDDRPPFLHPSIVNVKLSSFELRLLVVSPFPSNPDEGVRKEILARAQQNLSVCWMGIEPEVNDGNS